MIAFKKRRRKHSKRKRGYRDEITMLRITEILADGKTPTIGPRPKKEKVVKPAEGEGSDEAPKAATKKADSKKTSAKKAAAAAPAKEAPAKKAPAKKPAAKKARSDD